MNHLKKARNDSGLSLDRVSSRIKVPKSILEAWESGELSPELSYAERLAKLYNRSVDYLAGLTDDPTPLHPAKKVS